MDKKTDKYLSSSEDYMYTMSHNDDDIDTYDGRDSRSSSMGGQPSRDTEILAPSLIAASARTNNNNNNDDNNAMEHVNKIRTKLTQWKPLHTITSHSHYQYSPPSSPTSAKARGRDNGNNNDNTNNSNLIRAHGTDIARDSSLSQLSGSGYDNVLPSSKTRSKHHYHSKGILRSIVCINNRGEISKLNADRATVMKSTSVPARDLRLLDHKSQSPASILIRDRALVLVLGDVRGILTHDRMMLITKPAQSSSSSQSSNGTGSGGGGGDHGMHGKTLQSEIHEIPFVKALIEKLTKKSASSLPSLKSRINSSNDLAELGHNTNTSGNESSNNNNNNNDKKSSSTSKMNIPSVLSEKDSDGHMEGDTDHLTTTTTTTRATAALVSSTTSLNSHNSNSNHETGNEESMPFEFLVLELVLEMTCNSLEQETNDIEVIAKRAVDSLATKVTTTRLEQVRRVKGLLSRLLTRARQVKEELSHLLDDDDDMRQMYLSRKYIIEQLELNEMDRDREINNDNNNNSKSQTPTIDSNDKSTPSKIITESPLDHDINTTNTTNSLATLSKATPTPHLTLQTQSTPSPNTPPDQTFGNTTTTTSTSSATRSGRRATSYRLFGSKAVGPVAIGPNSLLNHHHHQSHHHHEALMQSIGQVEIDDDFDDMEDMLETFHEAISGTFARLTSLDEYVEDGEAYISLHQDSLRNQIISFDLMLTMTTLCVTIYSCLASIFGMNLKSGLEHDHPSFVIVTVMGLLSSVAILIIMLAYMRKKRLL